MPFWKRWIRKGGEQTAKPDSEEIRRFFNFAAADEEHYPSTIDPRLYHVKLVLQHLGAVGGGRVLDAGCGKGRFARIVNEHHPTTDVVAMDLAEAMLRFVPDGALRCAGSLTELPFASECFDGVYATESLEHAIDIPRAVQELVRVLKPGGRLIIIDKNKEHWGRLETPAWETWFGRRELERLLKQGCRSVESRPISYWEDVEPDGLFLAWLATK
jgi:malonyl-CoA O-methyltransferase